jgi:NAD-dependent SIR2 family protein deacetylase
MSWKTGLVHINCVECHRDLDWAQPQFLERHPMPRCWTCKDARQAVYAVTGPRQLPAAPPTRNELVKAMRPGNRFFGLIRRWTA